MISGNANTAVAQQDISRNKAQPTWYPNGPKDAPFVIARPPHQAAAESNDEQSTLWRGINAKLRQGFPMMAAWSAKDVSEGRN